MTVPTGSAPDAGRGSATQGWAPPSPKRLGRPGPRPTPKWVRPYLAALSRGLCRRKAAQRVRIHRNSAILRQQRYPEFRAAVESALAEGLIEGACEAYAADPSLENRLRLLALARPEAYGGPDTARELERRRRARAKRQRRAEAKRRQRGGI